MSDTSTGPVPRDAPHPLTRVAVGMATAAVVLWVALVAADHDGPLWLVWALVGVGTAVVSWKAGGTSPRNRTAFVCFLIGLLAVLVFIGFVLSDL